MALSRAGIERTESFLCHFDAAVRLLSRLRLLIAIQINKANAYIDQVTSRVNASRRLVTKRIPVNTGNT